MSGDAETSTPKQFSRALGERHPQFFAAVAADARVNALYRGERSDFRSKLDLMLQVIRLAFVSDAFGAQILYRAQAALQRRRLPLLSQICHRLSMTLAQVAIGAPVYIEPGVYIVHGQVVIDGLVEIGADTTIAPWVTIGLKAGNVQGARIGRGVSVGTGAKIIGPVTIGDGARIGANAVVIDDVVAGTTVVGAPARATDLASATR